MTAEALREIAFTFPGVTEDLKWGHDLCFLIGEKMFLVMGPDNVPVTASFKTTDELFEELCVRDEFIPAPYMARNKWVQVIDIGRLTASEWKQHVERSYDLVLAKLPKKYRDGLVKG